MYVCNVSLVKEGHFSDFQLQSKDKYLRGVCFSPPKRQLFKWLEEGGSPVKIKKFRLSTNSNTDDLLMNSNLEIKQLSASPFPRVDIPSTLTLGMLKTIVPAQLITLKAKVTALQPEKTLETSKGPLNMVEGQIVDTQGYSKIIFWQDFCNQVNEGSTYFFENL